MRSEHGLRVREAAFQAFVEIADLALQLLVDDGDAFGEAFESLLKMFAGHVEMAAHLDRGRFETTLRVSGSRVNRTSSFLSAAVDISASFLSAGVDMTARFDVRRRVLLPHLLEQPFQFIIGHSAI